MNKTDGRNVFLGGEINGENVKEVMEEITALHKKSKDKWITLYLNSAGGLPMAGFAFYDYITTVLKPKLQIVLLGDTSSIALIVFLSAESKHRYMGKHSYAYLHNTSHVHSEKEEVQVKEAETDAKNLRISNEWYKEIVLDRTGGKLTKKGLTSLMNNYKYIYPEEAIELGFAHKIL